MLTVIGAGATTSAPVSFTIDTVPPSVSITVPANGSNQQPTLTATAADNLGGSGLASVQFQYSANGGVTWLDAGPAETAAPFSYTFPAPLPDGTYQARAIATDNAGNSVAAASSLATVHSFSSDPDGATPWAGLMQGADGNLYGTTVYGGTHSDGAVFELNPTTGAVSTVASFSGSTSGAYPQAGLIADPGAGGNLYYGTTYGGGVYLKGTVFEVDPSTGVITTLATFTGPNGAYPNGQLFADASGNLYGTTWGDQTDNYGTVFELNPKTLALTTLTTFDRTNGAYPDAGLVADASGNLYGTTSGGGNNANGTVFELNPSTKALTTLIFFNGTDGSMPYCNLIMDSSGNLYGTTDNGGANSDGTVFELNPNASTPALNFLSFSGPNGAYPQAGLVADASGNLYGVAWNGGGDNQGTLFEVDHNFDAITTLSTFDGANGAAPLASLMIDSATGLFYGTTSQGGTSSQGTVFDFSPSATFTISPVSLVATTTLVSSSANPSMFGQSVTFTATVNPNIVGAATPTGSVTFMDGATVFGMGTISNGSAICTTSTLAVASHTITAVYGGDANFSSSTSAGVSQVVSQDATSTLVTSTVNPAVLGQSVTFTATVTPGTGTFDNGGAVQFQVDGSNFGARRRSAAARPASTTRP